MHSTLKKTTAQLRQGITHSLDKASHLGGRKMQNKFKKTTAQLRQGIAHSLDKASQLGGRKMLSKSLGLVKCRMPRAFCHSTYKKTTAQLKGGITDSQGKAHSFPEHLRPHDIMRRPGFAYYNKARRHHFLRSLALQRFFTPPPPTRSGGLRMKRSLHSCLFLAGILSLSAQCGYVNPGLCGGDQFANPDFECMPFAVQNLRREMDPAHPTNPKKFFLAWDPAPGGYEYIQMYKIEKGTASFTGAEVQWQGKDTMAESRGPSMPMDMDDASTEFYYYFRVTACSAYGCGLASEPLEMLLGHAPPELSGVQVNGQKLFSSAAELKTNDYRITWEHSPDVDGNAERIFYQLQDSADDSVSTIEEGLQIQRNTNPYGYTYQNFLRTCERTPKESACGPWSMPFQVAVDLPAPLAENLTLSSAEWQQEGKHVAYDHAYTLAMSAPASLQKHVASYELQERISGDVGESWSPWSTVPAVSGARHAFTSKQDGDYGYSLRFCPAGDDARCSAWSGAVLSLSVLSIPPPPPAAFQSDEPDPSASYDGIYRLVWEAPDGAPPDTYYVLNQTQRLSGLAYSPDPAIPTAEPQTFSYELQLCLDHPEEGEAPICSEPVSYDIIVQRLATPAAFAANSNNRYFGQPYRLSWGRVTGAVEYRFDGSASGAGCARLAPKAQDALEKQSMDVMPEYGQNDRTCTYKIQACPGSEAALVCSEWSPDVSIAYKPLGVPVLTHSQSGQHGDKSYDGKYFLSWQNVDGAARYQFEEKAGSATQHELDTPRYPKSALTNNKLGAYAYMVRACSQTAPADPSDASCGAWSASYSVSVEALPVPKDFAISLDPSDVSQSEKERTSYNDAAGFSWSAVTGAKSYIIEESSDDGANWSKAAGVDAPALSASITRSLPASGTDSYIYRIKACTVAGGGGPCSSPTADADLLKLHFRTRLSQPASFALSTKSLFVGQPYDISWDAVTDTQRYELARCEVSCDSDENWNTIEESLTGSPKSMASENSDSGKNYSLQAARLPLCDARAGPWLQRMEQHVLRSASICPPLLR